MILKGSCHCQAIRYEVNSPHPYPYNICYCSICRKTAGGGGYAINLGAEYQSLKIKGKENISIYQVKNTDSKTGEVSFSPAQRVFCRHCGSFLWVWDSRWPELVHPFASSIDTKLPIPPEHTHLMLGSKADWVECHFSEKDKTFDQYPDESIAQWHERLGLKG